MPPPPPLLTRRRLSLSDQTPLTTLGIRQSSIATSASVSNQKVPMTTSIPQYTPNIQTMKTFRPTNNEQNTEVQPGDHVSSSMLSLPTKVPLARLHLESTNFANKVKARAIISPISQNSQQFVSSRASTFTPISKGNSPSSISCESRYSY
jgi:hypothetical protein